MTVAVTFLGVNANLDVAVSFDKDGNIALTEADINQHIKNVINNDADLQHLLIAKDGAGNSLILESLVDGAMTLNSDLKINVTGTAVSGGTTTNLVVPNAINTTYNDDQAFGRANNGTTILSGLDSEAHSDNVITLGTGDDLLVMGTGAYSNDMLKLVANFGNDTVVNFVADNASIVGHPTGMDSIDLAAFGIIDGFDFRNTSATSVTENKNGNVIVFGDDKGVTDVNELTTIFGSTKAVNCQNYVCFAYDNAVGAESDVYKVFTATGTADGTFGNLTQQGSLELAGGYGTQTGVAGAYQLSAENFVAPAAGGGVTPPTPSTGKGTVLKENIADTVVDASANAFKFSFGIEVMQNSQTITINNFGRDDVLEFKGLTLGDININAAPINGDNTIVITYTDAEGDLLTLNIVGDLLTDTAQNLIQFNPVDGMNGTFHLDTAPSVDTLQFA